VIERARGATVLLAMALLLNACSIGSAQAPPRSALVAPPAKPTLVYAAIGASESLGVGAKQPTTDSWPQVFYRTALPEAAVYYNFGISGDTVSGATIDQVPEALGIDPTLVTVWLNVNDILAGVPPSLYHDQLDQLVHDLRRGGTTRVLVANVPYLDQLPVYLACHGGPISETVRCPTSPVAQLGAPELNALVDAYNAGIADVVQREGVTLVDLHSRGETPLTHPEWVSEDGFHPSTAGYAQVAAAFAAQYRGQKSR
jgi:acyl-CoA thioesterase I